MALPSIPLLMVIIFLLLTLVVGLYSSSKATTFREYAIGNKRFSTATLVVTLLATVFSGLILFIQIPKTHHIGLEWILEMIFGSLNFWVTSCIGLRMGPFMHHLSIAETIGSVYGKYPRIITALLGFCWCISIVAIQINIMFSIIIMYIDWIDPGIIVLASLILITYSTYGGIRAVTNTSVLQFITFMVIILLFAKLMYAKTGKSILEIFLLLQKEERYQFKSLLHFDRGVWSTGIYVLISCLPLINPSIIQRAYMCSSPIQVKRVFLYTSFFVFFITFTVALISIFISVGNPTLPKEEVWNYIIANVPPFFRGCIAICILGMAMSTADAALHISAIMVIHDVLGSIWKVKYKHQLWPIKLTSLVVGLLAIVIAVCCNNQTNLFNYMIYSSEVFFSAIVAPFTLAIFGFRGTSRTALIGMATGTGMLVFASCCKWAEPIVSILDLYTAIAPCGLAMIAAHYLLPQPAGKGWVGLDNQQRNMLQLIRLFKKGKKMLDSE